jgi:DNA-directed RNA polymerase III subunit RPC1
MGRSILPFEIMEIVEAELQSTRYQAECADIFMDSVKKFVQENIANRLAKVRRSHGMYDALDRPTDWDIDMDLSMGAPGTASTGGSGP